MNAAVHRQDGPLNKQVAIVTGGTVGIGRAVCIALMRAGANVVVVGRNQQRLRDTQAELARQGTGAEALALALDVRKEEDMQEMATRTLEALGRIDILIASAGILRARGGYLHTLDQLSTEEWDEVLDTNLTGVFLANRAVLPTMIRQRHGNIINIASVSGRKGLAFDSAYCASKFGVIGLTEALAAEVRRYGIRVQAILPGEIATGIWEQNGPIPLPKDILTPETVAKLLLYLITLPEDVDLVMPVIEPFKTRQRTGWLGYTAVTRSRVAMAGNQDMTLNEAVRFEIVE